MNKLFFTLLIAIILLAGCGLKNENIVFSATIESIHDNSIMVTTSDDLSFDKASVDFDKKLKIPFTPAVGQTVEIEALPEIRESYPVQITAVKISLKDESKKAEYKKITPNEAIEMMSEDVIILDVRTKAEFDEGHIPNAVLLPDADITQRAEEALPDKDQTILVYCRSGRRSALAAKDLIQLGYTSVYDFGGILDWPGEVVK